MRILITGGTGFIGSRLVKELSNDAQIVVLTRDASRANRQFDERIEVVESLNLLDPSIPFDAIINLAGENLSHGRWNARRKASFLESRLSVTREIVEFIQNSPAPPPILVSGSAVGFYGACGETEIDESRAAGDEYQSELCRSWEAEALRAESVGTRVCLIRTGIVLGKGGALQAMLLPFRFGLGGWLGNGRQFMSWIHIDDMVGLIGHLIARKDLQHAFNATAPQPVTNKMFSKTLGQVLKRPVLFPIPAFLLRLLVGEMSHLLLTGQNVVPQRLMESGYQFRFPELSAALADVLRP